jgi:glyoxylase-like metal-dependent hydrolase (beta-lactamase superfamily II)
MDVTEVVPGLHLLSLDFVNAYLWHEPDAVTVIDTGLSGNGPAIEAALEQLRLRRSDLRRIVLTHFHDDHAGSAAELASRSGAPILVGRGDAPFVRGEAPGPPPVVTPAEQALYAVATADVRPAPAVPVVEPVDDGDVLDVAGGAVVLAVPGHTPGSIALHLPRHGVLITGDTVAEREGGAILGPFNTDRAGAWASLQRLASLDVEVACPGHGRPITGAAAALCRATDPFG